jgi:murein DD-endopeptidase MepM/ murein hydrolase activator NlpD
MRLGVLSLLAFASLAFVGRAEAAGDPSVAALQVGLRNLGLYAGTIDGVSGPATTEAVHALQRRARLTVDGVAGPKTRAALGRFGRPRLGKRPLRAGAAGWDVAALQFLLAWHGFPAGPFDGELGPRTSSALRRFQRWARLAVDGVAGPATLAALRSPPPASPVALAWPLAGPLSDVFGPRGARFHAGIDVPADSGVPVSAAASGRVAYAGWRDGWGKLVTLTHGSGVRTMYAHLSRIGVRLGERMATGASVGLVGSTGRSTGPHLHFEVRVRGAAVDPLTALP